MRRRLAAALLPALLLLAGCASESEPKVYTFAPVPAEHLVFGPAGSLVMEAGKPGELTLALRNQGQDKVYIPEWRINEPDNVKLYCQPRPPQMEAPDEELWIEMDDPVRTPEYRYRLELYPRNQVLVKRTLGFVENLVLRPGTERRYFVKAELNLTSLPLQTEVFEISVIPPQR